MIIDLWDLWGNVKYISYMNLLRGVYHSLIISDLWDVWGNLSASGLPPDAASSRLDAFAGPPAQVHHHHHPHKTFGALHITSSHLWFQLSSFDHTWYHNLHITTSPYHCILIYLDISTHHHYHMTSMQRILTKESPIEIWILYIIIVSLLQRSPPLEAPSAVPA